MTHYNGASPQLTADTSPWPAPRVPRSVAGLGAAGEVLPGARRVGGDESQGPCSRGSRRRDGRRHGRHRRGPDCRRQPTSACLRRSQSIKERPCTRWRRAEPGIGRPASRYYTAGSSSSRPTTSDPSGPDAAVHPAGTFTATATSGSPLDRRTLFREGDIGCRHGGPGTHNRLRKTWITSLGHPPSRPCAVLRTLAGGHQASRSHQPGGKCGDLCGRPGVEPKPKLAHYTSARQRLRQRRGAIIGSDLGLALRRPGVSAGYDLRLEPGVRTARRL